MYSEQILNIFLEATGFERGEVLMSGPTQQAQNAEVSFTMTYAISEQFEKQALLTALLNDLNASGQESVFYVLHSKTAGLNQLLNLGNFINST